MSGHGLYRWQILADILDTVEVHRQAHPSVYIWDHNMLVPAKSYQTEEPNTNWEKKNKKQIVEKLHIEEIGNSD